MDIVGAGGEERLPEAWVDAPLQEKESQGKLCPRKDCQRGEGVEGQILILLLSLWVLTLVSKGEVLTIKQMMT